MEHIKYTAKAVAAAAVCAAAYLVGVLPDEGGLADVTTVQWLGLVVFMGGAFGITYGVTNGPRPIPRDRRDRGALSVAEACLLLITAAVLLFVVLELTSRR